MVFARPEKCDVFRIGLFVGKNKALLFKWIWRFSGGNLSGVRAGLSSDRI